MLALGKQSLHIDKAAPVAEGLIANRLQHDADPHRLASRLPGQVILKLRILGLGSWSLFDHDGLAGLRGRSQIPRGGSPSGEPPPLAFRHHLGRELRRCRVSLDQGHFAPLDFLGKHEIVRKLLVRQIGIWHEGAQQRQVLIIAGGECDRLLDRVMPATTLGKALINAPLRTGRSLLGLYLVAAGRTSGDGQNEKKARRDDSLAVHECPRSPMCQPT